MRQTEAVEQLGVGVALVTCGNFDVLAKLMVANVKGSINIYNYEIYARLCCQR